MKFTCQKEQILKSTIIVEGAVSGKSTIQLLANILVECKDGKVELSATDLELASRTSFPASIQNEGAITVNAKKFIELLRIFPDCTMEFEVNDHNQLKLFSTEPKVRTNFAIQGVPKDDFPEISPFNPENAFDFPMESLKRMIRKTLYAVSVDDARYFLQGIFIERENSKLNFVATDGKRLALINDEIENIPETIPFNVIIPKKVLFELSKLLGNEGVCQVCLTENKIFFKVNNTELSSNLIEGKYPDYRQIVPTEYQFKATINTDKFQRAIEGVSKMLDSKTNRLTLVVSPGLVTINAYHPDFGEGEDEIACEYSGIDPITLAFNYKYVIDALKEIDTEEFNIELRAADKAIIIRGLNEDNCYSMIMPMNIKQNEPEQVNENEESKDEEVSE